MSYESSTPAQLRAFFEQHEIHTVETAVADSQGTSAANASRCGGSLTP